MYDDSYVPGFEDSEAVSAHGEGGGGEVGVTPHLPWTLTPVQDFEKRLCGGAGRVGGRSRKVGRWVFMPEAPQCPRPRARGIGCVPGGASVGERLRAGGSTAQDRRVEGGGAGG